MVMNWLQFFCFITVSFLELLQTGRGTPVFGVNNLSKSFIKRENWLKPPTTFWALRNVSLKFEHKITAFVGPSGSGKSTLAKIIAGREDATEGTIIPNQNKTTLQSSCGYLDPLFYMQYDLSRTANQILIPTSDENKLMLHHVMEILQIPLTLPITSLLESQRRSFEILLAISQIPNPNPPILILDEYLDKDLSVVRTRINKILHELCNHPEINLQVFLITHSRSVMREVADHTVVLKKGDVFAVGHPQKITLPAQLLMLD
eukprot:gene4329-8617_t